MNFSKSAPAGSPTRIADSKSNSNAPHSSMRPLVNPSLRVTSTKRSLERKPGATMHSSRSRDWKRFSNPTDIGRDFETFWHRRLTPQPVMNAKLFVSELPRFVVNVSATSRDAPSSSKQSPSRPPTGQTSGSASRKSIGTNSTDPLIGCVSSRQNST